MTLAEYNRQYAQSQQQQQTLDKLCHSCDGYKGFFCSDNGAPPTWHRCTMCNATGLRCEEVKNS